MKWISVKDRLPGEDKGILITDGKLVTCCEISFWKSNRGEDCWTLQGHNYGGWEYEIDIDWPDVTYWMPLPEPPKEK